MERVNSLGLLRRLCARGDTDLQRLRLLDDALSGLLLSGGPPLQDVARALSLFERAHWQPSALCLKRAARWLQACAPRRALEGSTGDTLEGITGKTLEGSEDGASEGAASVASLEDSRSSVECARTLARAWAALAVRSVRQPDSVAVRTLTHVLAALGRWAPAAGAADTARLTIATELRGLRSVAALEDAEARTGGLWDFHCTISALTALDAMCARPLSTGGE